MSNQQIKITPNKNNPKAVDCDGYVMVFPSAEAAKLCVDGVAVVQMIAEIISKNREVLFWSGGASEDHNCENPCRVDLQDGFGIFSDGINCDLRKALEEAFMDAGGEGDE